MRRLFFCFALLVHGSALLAADTDAAADIEVDATDLALSFGQGRIQWRFEAFDVLPVPVFEPFGGVVLGEDVLLAQELARLSFDPDDERQFILSITIDW